MSNLTEATYNYMTDILTNSTFGSAASKLASEILEIKEEAPVDSEFRQFQ